MSNIPTPQKFPPTTAQVDATLGSVLSATQSLLNADSNHYAALRASFIKFYSHPTFQLVLGVPHQAPSNIAPSPPDKQLTAELAEIKSTISALSKAVTSLQPKAKGAQAPSTQPPPPKGNPSAQGKGPSHVNPPTFASTAASKARPSLVMELGAIPPDKQNVQDITGYVNGKLSNSGLVNVQLSAARYTKQGNLVLTAHHATIQSQFQQAIPLIKILVKQFYSQANTPIPEDITARPNVKWSKILINSVPVGISDSRGPWTPNECNLALVAHNPFYASLTITQKPSWVRPPSTLKQGTLSSLVVAFEDPDGSARRTLLSSRQLFLLGTRAVTN